MIHFIQLRRWYSQLRNCIGSTSQLPLQHAHTVTSSVVASSFHSSSLHSSLITTSRTVGSSITLRDAVNQLTTDVRAISQKQDHIIQLLESSAGTPSEEGAELDLGQLTLPVSTDEELEQLVVIFKDRGVQRRLVSAMCWLVSCTIFCSVCCTLTVHKMKCIYTLIFIYLQQSEFWKSALQYLQVSEHCYLLIIMLLWDVVTLVYDKLVSNFGFLTENKRLRNNHIKTKTMKNLTRHWRRQCNAWSW